MKRNPESPTVLFRTFGSHGALLIASILQHKLKLVNLFLKEYNL